ncbi:MAG: class I SAM-dependent methyltransferase [Acetobacteraceae bacterium]|jgi:NADH dehydrogenase [ubiquinone] 1 alpha subcomplex assembly factor 7
MTSALPENTDAPKGAERLDHFMARAAAAYYAARDPFQDFTTSPEISQAFGECLGLWAAVTWQAMGRPDPVVFVECGPGRGSLMADALRAIAEMMPEFRGALRVHLVETSPRLREAQAAKLCDAGVTWHEDVGALPEAPMILLANEFLDALPIRQFIRRGAAWYERFVADGAFVEVPSNIALPQDAPEGAVREVNEAALGFAAWLGARLARHGGAALLIDYGPAESGFGDSLQAMRAGQPVDPLSAPGQVDITAHMDFAAFAAAARATGAVAHGPLPQGVFLQRLGFMTRTAMLARLDPARAQAQLAAAHRLTAPEAMGRLFKALALCDSSLPIPAGFETA